MTKRVTAVNHLMFLAFSFYSFKLLDMLPSNASSRSKRQLRVYNAAVATPGRRLKMMRSKGKIVFSFFLLLLSVFSNDGKVHTAHFLLSFLCFRGGLNRRRFHGGDVKRPGAKNKNKEARLEGNAWNSDPFVVFALSLAVSAA